MLTTRPPRRCLWSTETFLTSSLQLLNRIKRYLTGKQDLCSAKFVFFSSRSKNQNGRPGLWSAETFFFSTSLQLLNVIQRNLSGSKISTSSTKFVSFWQIRKPRWLPWYLIGWDIFHFFSATAEWNLKNLIGSKISSSSTKFVVFWPIICQHLLVPVLRCMIVALVTNPSKYLSPLGNRHQSVQISKSFGLQTVARRHWVNEWIKTIMMYHHTKFELPNAFHKNYMNVQSCIMSMFLSFNIVHLFRQTNPQNAKIENSIKY